MAFCQGRQVGFPHDAGNLDRRSGQSFESESETDSLPLTRGFMIAQGDVGLEAAVVQDDAECRPPV